ncbi:hypothetical protein [Paludifilum halophilum]|nr:hypothetical protein [Paludifilum halophilum]
MEYGKIFLDEYPQFHDVIEKLYFKREWDDWYLLSPYSTLDILEMMF